MTETETIPAPAGIGHNLPPDAVEEFDANRAGLAKRTEELVAAANAWSEELGLISSEAESTAATDFIAQLRALRGDLNAGKRTEKQPHLDANKRLDAAYKVMTDLVDTAGALIKDMQTGYLKRLREAQEAAAEEERRKAAAARAAAEQAAKEAASAEAQTVEKAVAAKAAEEEAKAQEKAAKRAAKATPKAASASGGGRAMGLRTTWHADLIDVTAAAKFFAGNDRLQAVLVSLGQQYLRSKEGDQFKNQGAEFHGFRARSEESAQ